MKYHAEVVFPNLVHVVETDVNQDIKDHCLTRKLNNPTGVFNSNCGGWQSEQERQGLITDKLYEIINETIQQSFNNKLVIAGSWVNINPTGSFNSKHLHPQCDLSGVYYIQVPEKSGDIVFEHPQLHAAHGEVDSYTPKIKEGMGQHSVISITPSNGLLMVFPSYLSHGVLPNEAKEDRISISFNIRITG